MSISIPPSTSLILSLPIQTFSSSVIASPETRIEQVQQQVDLQSQFVSDAKHAEFKIITRRAIAEMRATVAEMRALGRTEYEINRVVDGLLQKFYSSSSTFFENNTQFTNAKLFVNQSNQAVGNNIGQFTLKSRTISFAPYVEDDATKTTSPVNMEEKKTQFAQCVQQSMDPESPLGAMPCLAHHSRGLTEAQKKELSDFEPNAIIGKALNDVAVVPAMISKAVNATISAVVTVAKALALGMASETWLETDPRNYNERMKESRQLLNGENKEFNAALKRTGMAAINGAAAATIVFSIAPQNDGCFIPDPLQSDMRMKDTFLLLNGQNEEFNGALKRTSAAGAAAIARWERRLVQLDENAQKKYRTIPGIIHEGLYGAVDTVLIIPWLQIARGATSIAKKATQHLIPAPHTSATRFNYAMNYTEDFKNFVKAKEFDGILSQDLHVVNFHDSKPLHEGRSLKWAIPVSQANTIDTIEKLMEYAALIPHWGERTHVTLSKIPAGTRVKFLHGAAKEQLNGKQIINGGGTQYRFVDFDPSWIRVTREIPETKVPPTLPLQQRLIIYKSTNWLQNRMISKRTKIVPEDLGIPSPEFFKDYKPFQSKSYGLEGWFTLKKDVLKVKIEWLKVPEGRFFSWMSVISNLKMIAKANGATTIQYEAQIVNDKLLRVMTRKFGEPSIEIKRHLNDPTPYHIFKIPVSE